MATILLDQSLLTTGHKSAYRFDKLCRASRFAFSRHIRRSRRTALQAAHNARLCPMRHREQDHATEAATIRGNPEVWRSVGLLTLASRDGVFDSLDPRIFYCEGVDQDKCRRSVPATFCVKTEVVMSRMKLVGVLVFGAFVGLTARPLSAETRKPGDGDRTQVSSGKAAAGTSSPRTGTARRHWRHLGGRHPFYGSRH
jgi:hypothetical protein